MKTAESITLGVCPYFQKECIGIKCLSFVRQNTFVVMRECEKYRDCFLQEHERCDRRQIKEYKESLTPMESHAYFTDTHRLNLVVNEALKNKCGHCEDNIQGHCKLLDTRIILSFPKMKEKYRM